MKFTIKLGNREIGVLSAIALAIGVALVFLGAQVHRLGDAIYRSANSRSTVSTRGPS